MTDGNMGFWVDGEEIHVNALKQEFSEQIAALKQRQEIATSASDRKKFAGEIEQAREAYEKKCSELPRLLF